MLKKTYGYGEILSKFFGRQTKEFDHSLRPLSMQHQISVISDALLELRSIMIHAILLFHSTQTTHLTAIVKLEIGVDIRNFSSVFEQPKL
uniref:Uncharacterized protein n=1 Tax=Ditylenchus dipsaci TaxID=166011 RepID=A0A915DRJ4_9BILA